MLNDIEEGINNKKSSSRSSKIFNSFKKLKPLKKLINAESINLPLKAHCSHNADILPEQLMCLRIQNMSSIKSLFTQKNIDVLIFGEVSIVGLTAADNVSCYLGILLSSGMLFLYEYGVKNRQILNFRIGINVRGAMVVLDNEVITMKSNVDIIVKVNDGKQVEAWYQKLCEASKEIEIVPKSKPKLWNSLRIKRKMEGSLTKTIKNQINYMKNSWTFSESMKEISDNSWNFNPSILSPLKAHGDSEFKSPVISVNNFVIDSNFKIISTLLARVAPHNGSFFMKPFVKSVACLTQYFLTITASQRDVSVKMNECNLEFIKNMKWAIRIINPDCKVDMELSSKESYEKWTLALMKTVAFHSKAQYADVSMTTSSNSTENQGKLPSENDFEKDVKLTRCLSCPKLEIHCKDERVLKNTVLLRNPCTKNEPSKRRIQSQLCVNNVSFQETRITPHRNLSCLDYPIPIIPDLNLSKSYIASCNSSSSDIGTIYDEMESTCCSFQFREDNNPSPLPIRCKKHGITKRLKKSYQQFAKKLIKSDLGKRESSSNRSFLSRISNKFKSEINLQSANKLENINEDCTQWKQEKDCRNFVKSNMSNSVCDVRERKFDIYERKYSEATHKSDDSDEYEEPINIIEKSE